MLRDVPASTCDAASVRSVRARAVFSNRAAALCGPSGTQPLRIQPRSSIRMAIGLST